ncbi:glycosyltransferase [Pseudomonadales bacterium]|nr:glycosyltransferase [Pseudomonadales bacterium]
MEILIGKTCILLAAYNGALFIREQIESIRQQEYKNWDLFVNIDCSDDETEKIVSEFCKKDERIFLLKSTERFGAAGKNFYDLLKFAPIEEYKFIAFSDQDDIWAPNKLLVGLNVLSDGEYAGYSSSVTAVYPCGKRRYIGKSNPQKLLDYKFESAGPGCTYIFTNEIGLLVRKYLFDHPIIERHFYYHDWLVYYATRNVGKSWFIDSNGYIDYRQHGGNDTGANVGFVATGKRLKLFRSGWYFHQVYLLEDTVSQSIPLEDYLGSRNGWRIRWVFRFLQTRRDIKHALLLGVCVLLRIVR